MLAILLVSAKTHVNIRQTYMHNVIFKLINYPVQLLVMYYLWWSVESSGNLDLSHHEIFTYYLWALFLRSVFKYRHLSMDIGRSIIRGDLAIHLARPAPFWIHRLGVHMGEFLLNTALSGVFVLVVLAFGLADVSWPAVGLGLSSLFLATIMAFFLYATLGCIAFWTRYAAAVVALFELAQTMLTGALLPLQLLPGFLKALITALPFKYLVYQPVRFFMGDLTNWQGLIIELSLWTAASALLFAMVWSRGIRLFNAATV